MSEIYGFKEALVKKKIERKFFTEPGISVAATGCRDSGVKYHVHEEAQNPCLDKQMQSALSKHSAPAVCPHLSLTLLTPLM